MIFLLKFELCPTKVDPCVYILKSDPPLLLSLFVDDGLACSTSTSKMENMIQHLEENFSITKSSGDLYVGLHIYQDTKKCLIFINETLYLRRIISTFGFSSCAPVSTPADPNVQLDSSLAPVTEAPFSYAAAVDSLMFTQTLTRPDINFAINTVAAQFLSHPQQLHYQAVRRIFRYLAGTINLALCYDGGNKDIHLGTYVDADYGGDVTDRKLRTDTLLLLNRASIAWASRKQNCVATSTT